MTEMERAAPLDGIPKGQELMTRATVEEIVGYRNQALELYGEAFAAIEQADRAIKEAHAMAARASGDVKIYVNDRENGCSEVGDFEKAVALPSRELYEGVARRLTDLRVWSWVIQRTDLERLMDAEAKETLRKQMRYIPAAAKRGTREMITGDEGAAGMPPVTVDNIYATIQQFALDADSIFRRGIANAFSKLDRRFRSHDGFKIGGRVILTGAFNDFSGRISYGRTRDTLMDVERTFAVLDNSALGVSSAGCLEALDQDRQAGPYGAHQSCTETAYFRIRGYANGNAHLWFTRDDLVEKVNKLLAEWYGEVIGDERTRDDPFAKKKTTPARRFGFFPTPDAAAEYVIDKTPLWRKSDEPMLTILEPSAGTGNLARRCATARHQGNKWRPVEDPAYAYRHKVDCVEIQADLARQLRDAGIYRKVHCADFLQIQPDPAALYDRVVMNPPFDLERDIDHVTHALKFLKPDGFLIAIMSARTEFRETRKAKALRDLVTAKHGQWDDLPACSFSSVGTNVNTIVLRLWNNGRMVY